MEHILAFSVRRRWLVLLMTLAATISGAWSLTKLPIDAVPDVTNVQVQVNAVAPSLSPTLVLSVQAGDVLRAALVAGAVALAAALIPIVRIAQVEPASVFRRSS